MDRYKVLEAIGEGSFGRVFRGKCLATGDVVALKFIPKRNKVEKELCSLRRECEIQRGLSHPNIVGMLDAFETENEVVAVSEYVPGQLFKLLQQQGPLAEPKVRQIACNLLSAVYYLHSHRIIHRDIKPQNILLDRDGVAKLCDFGFSCKLGIDTYVLTSIKGTPLYMAPELIEERPYDHTVDLWSLGCILFELLVGKPPFCTTSIVQLVKMVRVEPIKWPEFLIEPCLGFIQGLLTKDSKNRLNWPELLDHLWVAGAICHVNQSGSEVPLTNALTNSQEVVKEQQRCKLFLIGSKQPKVLSRALAGHSVAAPPHLHPAEVPGNIKDSDSKPKTSIVPQLGPEVIAQLSALQVDGTDSESDSSIDAIPLRCRGREKMIEVHVSSSESNSDSDLSGIKTGLNNAVVEIDVHQEAELRKAEETENDIDARSVIGASVRKLSRISQEPGFEEKDVQDLKEGSVMPELRKDSMNNYLANSFDSSRRGSRPSNAMLDMGNVKSVLPNICEESGNVLVQEEPGTVRGSIRNSMAVFTLHSFNSERKVVEVEEWSRFLDKVMYEVMNGNTSVYRDQGEMSMVISPLRNRSSSHKIVEKVIVFLMLPFTISIKQSFKLDMIKVFMECKVVPNLLYASKLMFRDDTAASKRAVKLDKDQVDLLGKLFCVICHLVHLDDDFILQFCDSVCVLNITSDISEILSLDSIKPELVVDVLAIFNQVLRKTSENSCVVEQVFFSCDSVLLLFSTLITHKMPKMRSRICTMIGYIAKCCPTIAAEFSGQHKLICDLINLESDICREVRKNASFAVTCLQAYTELVPEDSLPY